MSAPTYRLVVIGSLLSSFMFGLHMPIVHEIVEHGAAPRAGVMMWTLAFVVGTVAGAWALLRQARRL